MRPKARAHLLIFCPPSPFGDRLSHAKNFGDGGKGIRAAVVPGEEILEVVTAGGNISKDDISKIGLRVRGLVVTVCGPKRGTGRAEGEPKGETGLRGGGLYHGADAVTVGTLPLCLNTIIRNTRYGPNAPATCDFWICVETGSIYRK